MSREQKESFILIVSIIITVIFGVVSTWVMARTQKGISDAIVKILGEQKTVENISKLVLKAQYRKTQLRNYHDDITIYRDPNYEGLYIKPIRAAGADIKPSNFNPIYRELVKKIKAEVNTFTSGAKISTLNEVVSAQFVVKMNSTMEAIEDDLIKLNRIIKDTVGEKSLEAIQTSQGIDVLFLIVLSSVILVSILMGVRLRKQTKRDIAKRLAEADTKAKENLKKERLEFEVRTHNAISKAIRDGLLPMGDQLQDDYFDIAAYMSNPESDKVGGDYYDFIKKGDTSWLLIGDVTGHDIESAIVMLCLKFATAMAIQLTDELTPDQLLSIVNHWVNHVRSNLKTVGKGIMRKTATFLVVKMNSDGTGTYAGNHPAMLKVSEEGEVTECESHESFLHIGLLTDPQYNEQIKIANGVKNVRVSKGEMLFLYTDGATEAVIDRETGEMLEEEGFKALLSKHAHLPVDEMINQVVEHMNSLHVEDDLTFLAARLK